MILINNYKGNNLSFQGKLLSEWQKDLPGYSIPELFRIVKDGGDLQKMILRNNGVLSSD